MTDTKPYSARGRAAVRWLVAAAVLAAVLASGAFSGLMDKAGFLYLILGSVAAALMGFRGTEIAAAFKEAAGTAGTGESLHRSAYFWEAMARNAWILGALGSAVNFTVAIGIPSESIAKASSRMIQSLVVTLYGLVLAVLCLVPAMKLADRAERETLRTDPPGTPPSEARPWTWDRIAGYVLFASVVGLTIFLSIAGRKQSGPLPIERILLHYPALLVVVGGTIALALFMGRGAGARAWTIGFAMTGLIGLLTAFIQALFGFAHRNIGEIAAACAFIISTSSLSLLGLVAVAGPLEDREVMEGRREGPGLLGRLFGALLPLLVFLFLVLTFIMVVTPMVKPGE